MSDLDERAYARASQAVRHVKILLSDDSTPVQHHQIEGFAGEIRNNIQRIQTPGHSSMPLPGAIGVLLWQGGASGFGTLIAVDDARYRPTGLKAGEAQLYAVDEADATGAGGKVWPAFQALLGKVAKVLGKTISMGDANTDAINLVGGGSVTINLTGQTVNINGAVGDVIVNGISLVNHTHTGVTAGGDLTGPPAA